MLADHAVKGKEPEGDDRKARRHKGKKAGRPERPEGTKQEGTTGEKAELFISTYKEVKSARTPSLRRWNSLCQCWRL
jgi:hypothetical protein